MGSARDQHDLTPGLVQAGADDTADRAGTEDHESHSLPG